MLQAAMGDVRSPEQLLDGPAPPIPVDHLAGLGGVGQVMGGQQSPMHRRVADGGVRLAHIDRHRATLAGACADRRAGEGALGHAPARHPVASRSESCLIRAAGLRAGASSALDDSGMTVNGRGRA